MLERILELIKNKKLTPSQFADEIGIQRSGMSHIISGRNNPSLEFVMKVLKRYPEIKPEWMLYGTLNPETNSEPEVAKNSETEKDKRTERVFLTNAAATLFDETEVADSKPEIKPQRILKKEKTGRKIDKIIIFYDDRSFREYDPEQ